MSLFTTEPYLQFYVLSEAPYSTKPNERYLYMTPPHKEAVAMVAKVMRDKEGGAVIYGKFGTGKQR
jgi:general secretion pathway protein A